MSEITKHPVFPFIEVGTELAMAKSAGRTAAECDELCLGDGVWWFAIQGRTGEVGCRDATDALETAEQALFGCEAFGGETFAGLAEGKLEPEDFQLQTTLTKDPNVGVLVGGGAEAMAADCIAAHVMLPMFKAARALHECREDGEAREHALKRLYEAFDNPVMG